MAMKRVFTYILSGVLLPPFQAPYECDYLAHFLPEKLAVHMFHFLLWFTALVILSAIT